MMPGGIFISCRRDHHARQAAGRLTEGLSEHFGDANVVRDIEGIEPGVDFVDALNSALESCIVMRVPMGPRWLDIRDPAGKRRLDDPNDWIRQEISAALQRGIRVVPVLVDGTPLPTEQDPPTELRPLVRRQAVEIDDSRWRGDLRRRVETRARVPGLESKQQHAPAAVNPPATRPVAPPPAQPAPKAAAGNPAGS